MKTKLSNTKAVQQMVHNIENLCVGHYDGQVYFEERNGYIFVQLSSIGHKDVRLQFVKENQTWTIMYGGLVNVYYGRTMENVIVFINTH